MTKQELIVLRGLPASGKTTWAEKWVRPLLTNGEKRAVVSRDSIRKEQFGVDKSVLSYDGEQTVTKIQQGMVDALLSSGYSVVIDDMNLRPKYVREWRRVAQKHGVEFDIEEFDLSVADSIRRDAERRASGVGAKVIIDLAAKYYPKGQFLPVPDEVEEPEPEQYVRDLNMTETFVFDLDGTLALNTGGRSYYDLSRVGEDTLNLPVMEVACALHKQGFLIVFCSGRSESSREETQKWLHEQLPWSRGSELIMREDGDQRRDFIVKAELFDKFIAPNYDVRGVFDDRPSVCRMWRAKGIPVFQVGDPHVEF